MNKEFIVAEWRELLALQRVFREAKFCIEPDDVEISDSPLVADMFKRLMDVLISREHDTDTEDATSRWEEWLKIDSSRDEWAAAIKRARSDSRWLAFSQSERVAYVQLLLSPFQLSDTSVDEFIRAVDAAA